MSHQGPSGGRIAFGVLLVIFATVCLSDGPWGGGKQRERWLAEMQQSTVTIDPHVINPDQEGKFVHVIGSITPRDEEYVDPQFGVSGRGFALLRQVWTYDYAGGDEGGGDGWYLKGGPIVPGDSPEAADPTRTVVWMPRVVRLGEFTLDPEIVSRWLRETTGTFPPADRDQGHKMTAPERLEIQVEGAAAHAPLFLASAQKGSPQLPGWRRDPDGRIYSRDLSGKPAYGDRRVEYHLLRIDPGVVTLLCRQAGDRLEPGPGPRKPPFFTLSLGELDQAAAFAAARRDVQREAWTILIVGVVLAAAGIGLIVWDVRALRKWEAERRRRPPAGSVSGPDIPQNRDKATPVQELRNYDD